MSQGRVTFMGLLTCLLPPLLLLLAKVTAEAQTETITETLPNFIAQDDLNDGQHEIRIHYNGVSAKQTSVRRDQGSSSGLVLRQIHHHHRLLTLVYVGEAADDLSVDGLSLRDCRLSGDDGEVAEFLEKFVEDAAIARTSAAGSWSGSLNNVTFVHLDEEAQLPEYLRPVLHFKKLRAQCREHRRSVKKAVRAQRRLERRNNRHHHDDNDTDSPSTAISSHQSHSRRRRWILKEFFILPGTKWCGNDDLATSFSDLDGHVGADKCCRKHDKCPLNIGGMTYKYGAYNGHPTTVSHCICDARSKRSLLNFRMPFTKWCGAHYDAHTYGDLGGLVRVDHCCRQHDLHCPYFIEFMKEKYGLWNTNLGTINHCGCDLRFKACLKMTGTAAADLVGDVFFNKMKTKCFSLERKKVCTKWATWFGPCTKYSIKQVAVLRDNVPYKF